MDGLPELLLLILVLLMAGTAAWATWRAAPYVPTAASDVDRLLDLAHVTATDTVYDLGSGDGRLLLAAARRGARAVGYEISLLPYLISQVRRGLSRDRARISIRYQDFFHVDCRPASVVVAFLLPRSMARLGRKLRTELNPGSRVVSYAFKIAGWEPVRKDKPTARTLAIWVYQMS